jgi:hypothetical protein
VPKKEKDFNIFINKKLSSEKLKNGDVVVQNIKNWNFEKASRIEVGEEEDQSKIISARPCACNTLPTMFMH